MTNETVSLSKHTTDPSMFADAADDFEGEVQYSDSITISNDADHSVIYVKAEAFFPEFQDRFDIDNPSILYESEIGGDGERCCSEYIEIEISDVYDTSGIHYKKIVPGRDEVTLCYLKDKVI